MAGHLVLLLLVADKDDNQQHNQYQSNAQGDEEDKVLLDPQPEGEAGGGEVGNLLLHFVDREVHRMGLAVTLGGGGVADAVVLSVQTAVHAVVELLQLRQGVIGFLCGVGHTVGALGQGVDFGSVAVDGILHHVDGYAGVKGVLAHGLHLGAGSGNLHVQSGADHHNDACSVGRLFLQHVDTFIDGQV